MLHWDSRKCGWSGLSCPESRENPLCSTALEYSETNFVLNRELSLTVPLALDYYCGVAHNFYLCHEKLSPYFLPQSFKRVSFVGKTAFVAIFSAVDDPKFL